MTLKSEIKRADPVEFGRLKGCTLSYGGAFNAMAMLESLGRDPGNLAEQVNERVYRRYLSLGRRCVLFTLELREEHCRIESGTELNPQEAGQALDMLYLLLGLDQPLEDFYRLVAPHPVMGPLAKKLHGVRMPHVPSLWEAVCWAVIGQQINLPFAYLLRNRLIAVANGHEFPGDDAGGLLLPFPGPRQVLAVREEQWRAAKFSRAKSGYLQGLARAFADEEISAESIAAMDDAQAEQTLLGVRGLGPWSAGYIMSRGLGRLDFFPVGDAGLKASLKHFFALNEAPGIREQKALMEPLRPYRGLATYYLWKGLGMEREG
ncbi:MAG: hypothetical protein OEZ59_07195 [Deltaproteobacteria bacterium]|nr:hypothetical protein [Deltaproteobacteria bacterium]